MSEVIKVTGAMWANWSNVKFYNHDGWESLDSFYDDKIDCKQFEDRKAESKFEIIEKGKW